MLFILTSVNRVHALASQSSSLPNDEMSSSSNMMKNIKRKPIIIFCHGSGDTGAGAQAWVQSLIPTSIYNEWQWIFPTAKPIPYQLSGGQISSVWYDRTGGFAPSFPEMTETVEQSTTQLLGIIEKELEKGRLPREIVIGGFSMGGNIAYQTAARCVNQPLGAVFGLSCYLNHDSRAWSLLEEQQNIWPPMFCAHGAADDFILPAWGQDTYNGLVQKAGIQSGESKFVLLPGVQHEMVPSEMNQLLSFLKTVVVQKNDASASAAEKESTCSDK